MPRSRSARATLASLAVAWTALVAAAALLAPWVAGGAPGPVHLPLVHSAPGPFDPCAAIPGASYAALTIASAPSDRPAHAHGDLNLALRGYATTATTLGLVDYSGGGDPGAPQLASLFADRRAPAVLAAYRVNDWDWGCNCRGASLTAWPATLVGLAAAPGETVHLPATGRDIGDGYAALVLYATQERITVKYTRDDNVVQGYTVHIEGVCVEPTLLALYDARNASGRGRLPALRGGQSLGRARGDEVGVAIRDNGTFMDPRSRKDWWQGY